jgi:N-acetylneuraminic acid mutarotase
MRPLPSAVWTGTEVIVWGGTARDDTPINTGGRYDPATDTWIPTSTGANVPSPRYFHEAVWTGTEMIVWGGNASYSTTLNTGGRYDPTTDTWSPTSTATNCPTGRGNPAMVWTGSRVIVNGGTWGRYDPSTDAWEPMAAPPVVLAGSNAVWTGSVMIVWGGGDYGTVANTGGRYDPATNTWALTSTGAGVPVARVNHSLVWTGSRMLVFGGWDPYTYELFSSGASYDPATNQWSPMAESPDTPQARYDHSAIWTGSEMIVWGGFNYDYSYDPINTGGRYDPATDTWAPIRRQTGVPTPRVNPRMAWTGTQMILWGGWDGDNKDDGWFYTPALDAWSRSMAVDNVPLAGIGTSTVWTGSEMIVWGGNVTNTGGRYDPVADAWTPTSTGPNVPFQRFRQATVWTGSEMVLWGGIYCYGCCSCYYTNTGARYDPSTDAWTPTSTVNVPTSRHSHTAVWTGNEMIVWGGRQGVSTPFNTGGRYDPTSDTWVPTSVQGSVPTPRESHGAVWTGKEMIVWGGEHLWDQNFGDGARYDPTTDSWASMAGGAPSARADFATAWTGTEMLVWGGWQFTELTYESGGGRYDPVLDRWTPISVGPDTPQARAATEPLWTGEQMIVWGGIPETATGGLYCARAGCEQSTWYRDSDGDGFGNPADSVSACTAPDGYVADGTDCDDSSPSIHPGAAEACNGLDDDCDGSADEDVLPVVTIEAVDSIASEPGTDLGLFRFSRQGCDGRNLYVHYAISGSAKQGRDYKKLFGETLIRSDRSSSTIPVRPRDDATSEPEEEVTVTIAPSAEYVVGEPATASVVILDDDAAPIASGPSR